MAMRVTIDLPSIDRIELFVIPTNLTPLTFHCLLSHKMHSMYTDMYPLPLIIWLVLISLMIGIENYPMSHVLKELFLFNLVLYSCQSLMR